MTCKEGKVGPASLFLHGDTAVSSATPPLTVRTSKGLTIPSERLFWGLT